MRFSSIVYSIIILPIESIIEFVFCFTLDKFDKFGVAGAIVAVSLVVNFLALPIYNVADNIQLKERELQKKMKRWVTHIKKAFHGDEQFMMLSAYYRLNNYHPFYALRQSLSILIQIPFFMAAYNFLSHCPLLENQTILFLKDLSKPDALIKIGGFTLNLLPVLMTAINIVSSIIYTKGAPFREKIQTFALAGIFLVLLYNSPSGLVFYWVLNQVFSLCKNVVNKSKKPNRIWHIVLSIICVFVSEYVFLFRHGSSKYTRCFLYAITLLFCALPLIKKCWLNRKSICERFKNLSKSEWFALKSIFVFACLLLVALNGYYCVFKPDVSVKKKLVLNIFTILFVMLPLYYKWIVKWCIKLEETMEAVLIPQKGMFALLLLSCASLCLLCGMLLPSSVIATSPAEFSFIGNTDSPLIYVWSSFAFFAGLFVFWPLVIYKMFGENRKLKAIMPPMFFVFAICALANAFLFKYDYGNVTEFFVLNVPAVLENLKPFFSILPLVFVIALCIGCFELIKFKKQFLLSYFMIAICLSMCFYCVKKTSTIKKEFDALAKIRKPKEVAPVSENVPLEITPVYHLSKTDKNVIVFFLDRAISDALPYVFEQFPELNDEFKGFVYYPDCLGFGWNTQSTTPSLSGGYEYTPREENKRGDEKLYEKHNEALRVMPKIFSDAGFNVTVVDPPEPNYQGGFDTSIYDGIPNVNTFEKSRSNLLQYYKVHHKEDFEDVNHDSSDGFVKKYIVRFSILESILPILRNKLYQNGKYYAIGKTYVNTSVSGDYTVLHYAELYYMSKLVDFNAKGNSFFYIYNGTTHGMGENPFMKPDFRPGFVYNYNSKDYDTGTYKWRMDFTQRGSPFNDFEGYCLLAQSFLPLGRFFKYLQENGCYDNTRIIIVGDHGIWQPTYRFEKFKNNGMEIPINNPMLMVKDFNSAEPWKTDYTFMTNAETVNIARKDLNVSDTNPYTGNKFKTVSDFEGFYAYYQGDEEDTSLSAMRKKNQWRLHPERGYYIHTSMLDEKNYTRIDKLGLSE